MEHSRPTAAGTPCLLLHISDTHFGTVQPQVADALVRLARHQQPDALVLSGDITQRATPAEFAQARAFCDSLGIAHMLAIPGNHDIPLLDPYQRFFKPYARYLAAFGPQLEPELSLPSVCVIGVNTTRWWRHKNGQVSPTQVDRVAARLGSAQAGQTRIVVVHQPVHVLQSSDAHDLLRGWEPAVRAWAAAGADLVLGGHIHLPYLRDLSSHLNGLERRVWCLQAGTALSSRVRDGVPNSVNLVQLSGQAGCTVERWDYQANTDAFACVQSRAVPLGAVQGVRLAALTGAHHTAAKG